MQAPDLLELRIPKGDEHDVEGDEHQGPPPDAAVPADERILSDSALQPWHARDQQNHHEHQIGADESGQATAGDQHASGSGERATRLAGDDQGDGGAQAETHERCERVCHEGHGGGGSASPGTSVPTDQGRCARCGDVASISGWGATRRWYRRCIRAT